MLGAFLSKGRKYNLPADRSWLFLHCLWVAEKVARNFEPLKSCGKDFLSYTAKSCVSNQTFISFEETQFSFDGFLLGSVSCLVKCGWISWLLFSFSDKSIEQYFRFISYLVFNLLKFESSRKTSPLDETKCVVVVYWLALLILWWKMKCPVDTYI